MTLDARAWADRFWGVHVAMGVWKETGKVTMLSVDGPTLEDEDSSDDG